LLTNTSAAMLATVDSNGHLIGLEVSEADSDFKTWRRIASMVLAKLKGRKLQAPQRRQRTHLTLRIRSRQQLPSGADPGTAVSVLGQTIKEGTGDRSHRIDILKPEVKLEMVEVPNPGGGEPLKLPQLMIGIGLLGLPLEFSDMGAHAQRIVSTEVEDVRIVPDPQ
jgi:hypothetical protein